MILNEDHVAFTFGGAQSPTLSQQRSNSTSYHEKQAQKSLSVRKNTLAHTIALKQKRQSEAAALLQESPQQAPPNPQKNEGGFEKEDISLEELRRLKEVFDEAAERTGDGQLDEEQFLAAFAPILGGSMSREQLRLWFMRIDASANGSVDWDEFSTFLLMSGDRNDPSQAITADGDSTIIMKDVKTLSVPPTECSATSVSGYNHSDTVTALYCHPRMNKYYTGSQDGTVRIWDSQTLEFDKISHNSKAWVTSMCPMRNDMKLCIASVDRIISVYDMSHGDKLYRSFVGNTTATDKYSMMRPRALTRHEIDMRNVATHKTNTAGESRENFKLRQDRIRLKEAPPPRVDLQILRQMDSPAMSMVSHLSVPDALFLGLSNGSVQAYDILNSTMSTDTHDALLNMRVHDGSISNLTWVDSLYGFFTTGVDGKIHTVNVDRKEARRINCHQRELHPIHDACWVDSARLLATCGTERHVSMWSTSSQAPPIILGGHLANVSHVCCGENENLLVSMDVEKCIKVWDLRTLRPLQSVIDYDVYRPMNRLTAMTYDRSRNSVVMASTAPVIWPLSKLMVPFPDPGYRGHQRNVLCVLYNPMFHQLVTADMEVVKIWQVENGDLATVLTVESLMQATDMSSIDEESRHKVYIVSAMTDSTNRRLLVGLTNGIVLIINFANGQVLREMAPTWSPESDRGRGQHQKSAIAECSYIEYFGAGVKKYVAAIRGRELLIWEDEPEGSFTIKLNHVLNVNLSHTKYTELFNLHQRTDPPNVQHWRQPIPLCCTGIPPGHLAVGTDAGITLIYGSGSFEVLAILGTFEPNSSITTIHYHEPTELLVSGRTDGKVFVHSIHCKDRGIELNHRHKGGHIPSIQSVAVSQDSSTLLVGDDEGYMYIWDILDLDLQSVTPFTTESFVIGAKSELLSCTGVFQAHTSEVSKCCFVYDEDNAVDMIATASTDCQARIFTRRGRFVGYVGCKEPWDLHAPPKTKEELKEVPAMNQTLIAASMSIAEEDAELRLKEDEHAKKVRMKKKKTLEQADEERKKAKPKKMKKTKSIIIRDVEEEKRSGRMTPVDPVPVPPAPPAQKGSSPLARSHSLPFSDPVPVDSSEVTSEAPDSPRADMEMSTDPLALVSNSSVENPTAPVKSMRAVESFAGMPIDGSAGPRPNINSPFAQDILPETRQGIRGLMEKLAPTPESDMNTTQPMTVSDQLKPTGRSPTQGLSQRPVLDLSTHGSPELGSPSPHHMSPAAGSMIAVKHAMLVMSPTAATTETKGVECPGPEKSPTTGRSSRKSKKSPAAVYKKGGFSPSRLDISATDRAPSSMIATSRSTSQQHGTMNAHHPAVSANAMVPTEREVGDQTSVFTSGGRRMANQKVKMKKKKKILGVGEQNDDDLSNDNSLAITSSMVVDEHSRKKHHRKSFDSDAKASVVLPLIAPTKPQQPQQPSSSTFVRGSSSAVTATTNASLPPPLPLKDDDVPLPPHLHKSGSTVPAPGKGKKATTGRLARRYDAPQLPPIIPPLPIGGMAGESSTARSATNTSRSETGMLSSIPTSGVTSRMTRDGSVADGTYNPRHNMTELFLRQTGRIAEDDTPVRGSQTSRADRSTAATFLEQAGAHDGDDETHALQPHSARVVGFDWRRDEMPETSRADVWRANKAKQQYKARPSESFDAYRATSHLKVNELDRDIEKMLNERRRHYAETGAVFGRGVQ